MTLKFTAAVFTLMTATSALAAEASWFLSAEELGRLTNAEQISYLKSVRQIMASLPQISDEFALGPADATKRRTPASSPSTKKFKDRTEEALSYVRLSMAEEDQWLGLESDVLSSAKNGKSGDGAKVEHAIWWLTAARTFLNEIPETEPAKAALSTKVFERLKFLEDNKSTLQKTWPQLSNAYSYLHKADVGGIDVCGDGLPDKILYSHESGAIISGGSSNHPDAYCLDRKGYRCMYAGFVLKSDPCAPPRKLPPSVILDGVSLGGPAEDCQHPIPGIACKPHGVIPPQLSCSETEVLCNPLLFGLTGDCPLTANMAKDAARNCLQKSKALCIPHSRTATSECAKQSEKTESLQTAAELIRLNPETWNTYGQSFTTLCTEHQYSSAVALSPAKKRQHVQDDIVSTCAIAQKRLTELHEKFRVPAVTAPAQPPAAGVK